MIVDYLKHKHLYQNYSDLAEVLNFLEANANAPFSLGEESVILIKDKIHYMCMEALTTPEPESNKIIWEAHNKYTDVYYIISGKIKVHINYIENMQPIDTYNEAKDVTHYEGQRLHEIILYESMFAMLPTGLVHKSLMSVEDPENIKMLIFKIKTN